MSNTSPSRRHPLRPPVFASPLLGLAGIVLLGALSAGCTSREDAEPPPAPQVAEPIGDPASTSPGETGGRGTSEPEDAILVDATEEWGVDFEVETGATGELLFPEMMGGGVAVLDADGDGDLDLYFVSGAPELGRSETSGGPVNRLFLQGEDGRFSDGTEGSGLGDPGYGTGVAVGDFDNDGREDVFVSNIGQNRLFRSLGGGRFEDVTVSAEIPRVEDPHRAWSTSAAFCDLDLDGFLDLYVVSYVVYDPTIRCQDKAGRPDYCGPDSYEDLEDVLLFNRGDGTFRDVSGESGITATTGAGLGLICDDLDGDARPDVYVANDGDPNQLWVNQGDGTFLDDALIMGASVNAAGLHEAGMGIVAADFDNDTDLDLFLTHLRDETNTFYRNLGVGIGFEDQTTRVGLAVASTPFTGFGTVPLDLDLDGDLDLAIVNGRVKRGDPIASGLEERWRDYGEPNLVYLSDSGSFRMLEGPVAAFVEPVEVGRGLASGDLDGDGDLDVVVTNIGSSVRLYRGEAPPGHWILVDPFDPELGRRAIGARVTVEIDGLRRVRTVQGAMSYLSASDPRAHFGLGAKGSLEDSTATVIVRWPGGGEETFTEVGIDRSIVLRKGEGAR